MLATSHILSNLVFQQFYYVILLDEQFEANRS